MTQYATLFKLIKHAGLKVDAPVEPGHDMPYTPTVGGLTSQYAIDQGYVPKTVRGPLFDPAFAYWHAGMFPPGMQVNPAMMGMQGGTLGGALGLGYATWRRSKGEHPSWMGHTGVGMLGGGALGIVLAKLLNHMTEKRHQMGIDAPSDSVFAPGRFSYQPAGTGWGQPVPNAPQVMWNAAANMVKSQSAVKLAQLFPMMNASMAADLPGGINNVNQAFQSANAHDPERTLGHGLLGAGSLIFGLAGLSPIGRGLRTLGMISRMGRLGRTFTTAATTPWWAKATKWLGTNQTPRVGAYANMLTGLKNRAAGSSLFRMPEGAENTLRSAGQGLARVGRPFNRMAPLAAAGFMAPVGEGILNSNERWEDRMQGLQNQLQGGGNE